MTAIETTDLTRRFGDHVAVDGLSVTVEEGDVIGFLGPNGAGKSTTINVLLGFLSPTSGSARVLDLDVATDALAIRRRIGLLPESFAPYPNLTGREHVVSAIEAKDADDDPDAILERVGLDPDAARRRTKGYSTGMRRRLGLGIALVGSPDLLILDEPSSGLDPNGVKDLRAIVTEENERGATVFFSSHVLDEVERVCDRVAILHQGTLVAVDEVDALRARLGAGAEIEAILDAVPDDLDLSGIDGVADVTVDGRTVRVQCVRAVTKMDVLRTLDDLATVEDVHIEEVSLEQLFDAFTSGELDLPDRSASTSVDDEPEPQATTAGGA